MDNISIVSIVKRVLKEQHISNSDLARKLKTAPTTIQGMLGTPSLQVQRLLDLSEVCNYNFYREVADLLSYEEPPEARITSMAKAVKGYEDRIKDLEMEVKILRQTLKDIAGK